MKYTYYGHSCFGVALNDVHLLFDPFISGNELAKHIDIDSIKADYILVSHGHADHLADAVRISKNTGATVVSNFEIVNWLQSKGVEKGHPLNIGGGWKFDFGRVTFVQALHSSTMPDGANGGNPGGFIIESSSGNFYYSGDTGLFGDMKLFGEMKKLDFAILPLGDNFTMGPDNALIAAQWIRTKKIIGVHFNTFPYIVINKEETYKHFLQAGIELIMPEIGQTITI